MPSPSNNSKSGSGGGGGGGSKKQQGNKNTTMASSPTTTTTTDNSTKMTSSPNTSTGGGGSSSKKSSSSTASTTTNGLLEYLQVSLPRKALLILYIEENRGRFVVRAILQQLNQISQQIIMRLHCTGGSFPLSGIQLWIVQSTSNNSTIQSDIQNVLLKDLYKWAIIQEYATDGDITLTDEFSTGLRSSLLSLESSPWIPLTIKQIESIHQQYQESSTKDNATNTTTTKKTSSTVSTSTPLVLPTIEDLERYTQLQWDTVLHFLVGTVDKKAPPPAVVDFLLQTNLMRPDPDSIHTSSKGSSNNNTDNVPLVITTKGYDFMLQDSYQQIWHFIVQYLYSIEQHPKGEVLLKEVLLLLICLTFARPGCPYAASSLKKDCRTMIKDLSLFGLLCTMKIGKTNIFYPTRLAMQLVGSSSSSSSNNTTTKSNTNALWSTSSKLLESSLNLPDPTDSSHLAIIVQTNFQLAAYTTSELHVSMLGLFCDVGTIRRLPNVVFMQITRDSIKSAFSLGIKAQQILRFLQKHTHPKLRSNTLFDSPVPGNVVDQIWLWDRELYRVQFIKVYQHTCVMGIDEYKAVLQYVVDKKYYNYTNERKQLLLFDYKHYDRIQSFVRQWRAQSISRNQKG
jgi:Transcription factor Tfb2/Transcription factor Tfb2 (p52) C-terminal domain